MLRKPDRVVVVGASGAGKSWLACRLAVLWKLPLIELDDLAWDGSWQLASDGVYLQRLEASLDKAEGRWMIVGNYSKGQHVYWQDAGLVIWLDLPLWQVLAAMLRRSFAEMRQGTPVCNGNRQNLRRMLWGWDSLLWWTLRTYARRRARYAAAMQADKASPHRRWVRLQGRGAMAAWLAEQQKNRC